MDPQNRLLDVMEMPLEVLYLSWRVCTVRFFIYGIFNYMGFLIHGRFEAPPGPPGQVQDLQDHIQDLQDHLRDHFLGGFKGF